MNGKVRIARPSRAFLEALPEIAARALAMNFEAREVQRIRRRRRGAECLRAGQTAIASIGGSIAIKNADGVGAQPRAGSPVQQSVVSTSGMATVFETIASA